MTTRPTIATTAMTAMTAMTAGGWLRRNWRTLSPGVVLALVLCGVFGEGLARGAGLFTAEALRWAEPQEHEVGAGNGEAFPSLNGNEYHFPGVDCGRCHVEGGKATNYVFTMAGTIFTDVAGSEPLEGAEIILEDEAGKTVSMTSNEEGNFFTTEGMEGAYKTWMRKGERTMNMVTVPSVGRTDRWMSCNMHHSPTGRRGALFIPGGTTLREYPDVETGEEVSFEQHVRPILMSNCRPCHVEAEAGVTTKRTIAGESHVYDYSGGLDLTRYGGLQGWMESDDSLLRIDAPDESTLLDRVVIGPEEGHAGGRFWYEDDPDYELIRAWIAQGAKDN